MSQQLVFCFHLYKTLIEIQVHFRVNLVKSFFSKIEYVVQASTFLELFYTLSYIV